MLPAIPRPTNPVRRGTNGHAALRQLYGGCQASDAGDGECGTVEDLIWPARGILGAVAGITAPCNITFRDPDLVSASSVPVRVVTTQLSSGKVDTEIFVLPTVMLDVRLRLQRQSSRQLSSQRWQHLHRRQAQSARHIEQPAAAIKAVGE